MFLFFLFFLNAGASYILTLLNRFNNVYIHCIELGQQCFYVSRRQSEETRKYVYLTLNMERTGK